MPTEGGLRTDVLVLGGGMAGTVAALAARRRGAHVTLVRRSYGATALSSGALDVAPDPLATPQRPRGQELSIEACIHHLAALRPDHPYAILQDELGRIPEVLAFAEEAIDGVRFVSPLEPSRGLATPVGTLKFSAGALDSVIGGDLVRSEERIGVVGFRHHLEYDAELWARLLTEACAEAGLVRTFLPVACDFLSREDDVLLRPFEIAQRIDDEPGAFVSSLGRALPSGVQRLLLPPVLSRGEPDTVLRLIEDRLFLPATESLATRLSVLGLRLQRFLDAALEREDVDVVEGEVRAGADRDLDTLALRSARPRSPPRQAFLPGAEPRGEDEEEAPIRAGAVVLATGKYLAGGLAKNGCLFEPSMRLPVTLPGRRCSSSYGLTSHELVGEQPFFAAGVRVDSRLHPLDEGGRVVDERLFACGDLLAGHDPAGDGTAMGVAVFTGYLAGRWAALAAAEGTSFSGEGG